MSKYLVTTSVLRIRSGPGTSFSVIGTLLKNQIVQGDQINGDWVQVSVLDESGSIVEVGEATRKKGNWWEYASRAKGNTIKAEAWDLPGNVTRQDLNLNRWVAGTQSKIEAP